LLHNEFKEIEKEGKGRGERQGARAIKRITRRKRHRDRIGLRHKMACSKSTA